MGQLLCSFSGVEVRRVVDRASGIVPEHAHDWPVLSIFVLGSYRNRTDAGELDIAGPSAVLYQPRAAHSNVVGDQGFEQIEIEFDPSWLGTERPPLAPVSRWIAGPGAAAAQALARACIDAASEPRIRAALRHFVAGRPSASSPRRPAWVAQVEAMLRADPHASVRELAGRIGLHPAWAGAAYARHQGESVSATAARLRVERAARLLRETDEPPAAIAAGAGFCDQSHMIRVFRRVLGRAPSDVRADRAFMRKGRERHVS